MLISFPFSLCDCYVGPIWDPADPIAHMGPIYACLLNVVISFADRGHRIQAHVSRKIERTSPLGQVGGSV